MRAPTLNDILNDPSTPQWADALITRLASVDPVDAANVLDVLAAAYAARLDARHEGARP